MSNPVSARRVAKALSVSQTPLQTPQLLRNKSVSPSELSNKKMKGLFKSKPRTPPEIVRQTRDLLLYTHRASSDLRESKREEKVNPSLPCFFYPNSDPSMFSFFFSISSLLYAVERIVEMEIENLCSIFVAM